MYLCSECVIEHTGVGHEVVGNHVSEKQVKAELQGLLDKCHGSVKDSSMALSQSTSEAGKVNTFYEQQMAAVNSSYDSAIRTLQESKAGHIEALKRYCREQLAHGNSLKVLNAQLLESATDLLEDLAQAQHTLATKPFEELAKLFKRAQQDLKQVRPIASFQPSLYSFTASLSVVDNCKVALKKHEDEMWACRFCSLLNHPSTSACEVCTGRRRPCKLCNADHEDNEACGIKEITASTGPARRYHNHGSKVEAELIEMGDDSANLSF